MTIGQTEFAGGTINFCSNEGIIPEHAEIYVDPPVDQGYGWTVLCSECDFGDKMLSKEGAKRIAKEHAKEHAPKVIVGKEEK